MRPPVSIDNTMNAWNRSALVSLKTPSADSGVNAFEVRPGRPVGTSVNSTTFRRTKSRCIARRTERLRHARAI